MFPQQTPFLAVQQHDLGFDGFPEPARAGICGLGFIFRRGKDTTRSAEGEIDG